MFFQKLVVRRKLRKLQQKKQHDKGQLEVGSCVRDLLIDLDDNWFHDYNRAKGSRLTLTVIHRNAESLIHIIETASIAIINDQPIPPKCRKGSESSKNIRLDQWLETQDRYPVKPEMAWKVLCQHLRKLFEALDQCNHEPTRTSHYRKLKYVFVDALSVMEIMLQYRLDQ